MSWWDSWFGVLMFPKLQIYNVFWSVCHNLTAFKWWTAVSQAVSVMVCISVFVQQNRLQTTLRPPGGEPTSIWRIQSTTQGGSLSTSWEKVSAVLLKILACLLMSLKAEFQIFCPSSSMERSYPKKPVHLPLVQGNITQPSCSILTKSLNNTLILCTSP